MKHTLTTFGTIVLGTALVLASFAFAFVLPALAVTPSWDATGEYVVAMEYLGTDYSHDMLLTQDDEGHLTGNGGSPAGENLFTWVINSGMVVGSTINFTANYTATPDAVTPLTTVTVTGVIADNGSMSGTWTDNYAGSERSGAWSTTIGTASSTSAVEPPTSSSTVTVTIAKYIGGSMATASSADYADFPMTATWDAENIGAGSGSYALSETNDTPYQAVTATMTMGANYATAEELGGALVGASCSEEKPFALSGYSYGASMVEAMTAPVSSTSPSFTNLQNDTFVIVWNSDCSVPGGQIGGEVVGADGSLRVTSVEMIDTTATANGSFTDGWVYVFHITAPTSEANLAMKFNDWLRTGGGGTIPVAGNMRISSSQADNGGATILLTATNTYSTPNLHLVADLDPIMDGRQVEITVEVAVPNSTPNGAYTTAYGVQSNP